MKKKRYNVQCVKNTVSTNMCGSVEIWVTIETYHEPELNALGKETITPETRAFFDDAIAEVGKVCPDIPAADWEIGAYNGPHKTLLDDVLGPDYDEKVNEVKKAASKLLKAVEKAGCQLVQFESSEGGYVAILPSHVNMKYLGGNIAPTVGDFIKQVTPNDTLFKFTRSQILCGSYTFVK